MATQHAEIEVWVLVDSDGDYETATTEETARERFEENVGNLNERAGSRLVKLTVKVPLPTVIELAGEVMCEESETALKVA